KINTAYAERDACLAKNAATDNLADAAAAARTAATACTEETEKLVGVVNRDGDPHVTEAIRQDSQFPAMGFVLPPRGQVTNGPIDARRAGQCKRREIEIPRRCDRLRYASGRRGGRPGQEGNPAAQSL